jgi:predicted small lipoprotein YifL
MRRFCLLLAVAFFLSACGMRGPLYLPKEGDREKKSAPRTTEEGIPEQ